LYDAEGETMNERIRRNNYMDGAISFETLVEGKDIDDVVSNVNLITDTNSYFGQAGKNIKVFDDLAAYLKKRGLK
jgi:hypothetical protein